MVEVKVQAKLQQIVITPENPLVEVGQSEIMNATAVYADGSTEVDVDETTGHAVAKATGDAVIHIQDASTGVMGRADVKVVP